MPLVKKLDPNWKPSENPNLQVGETIEMTDPKVLVQNGQAVLIDKYGNEIRRESGILMCPICSYKTDDAFGLASHILTHQKAAPVSAAPEIVTPEPEPEPIVPTGTAPVVPIVTETTEASPLEKAFKDMTPEEQKAWRVNMLQKAREAKKAKEGKQQ